MGKVLHASYSGYFPWCESSQDIAPYSIIGTNISEIMLPFWRVSEWDFSIAYDFGSGIVFENEFFIPEKFSFPYSQIETEEDFVCAFAGVGKDGLVGGSGQIHFISFGGTHFQNSLGFDYFREGNDEQGPVSIDPDYSSPSYVVGEISISGNGFSFAKQLYSDNASFVINVYLVASQYWSYGGTYNILTGNLA